MANLRSYDLQDEEIGRYQLGRLYSESFSGIPYEVDISMPIGVGRKDSFNHYASIPGGPQKTLRIVVLLHETAHFVHDLSLGACMEFDYLTDTSLAVLLQVLRTMPELDQPLCPILRGGICDTLKQFEELAVPLNFLEERAALAYSLLSGRADLPQFADTVNPIFCRFTVELSQLSGRSLLEGIAAVKTLVAMAIRVKDEADIAYLNDLKETMPLLPERMPAIYTVARRIFDGTIGEMIGVSTAYYKDDWPRAYASSPRAISDEGFLYLADMALHIPPFEYSVDRIRKGKNQWEDFIPVNRFIREINVLLGKGGFPPSEGASVPTQFYRTVFDFIAKELGWPSYEETNYAWSAKLAEYKKARHEAADGYRSRMLTEKHLRPTDIVVSDAVDACMRIFVPIIHLTPAGLKFLGGWVIGGHRYFAPFEMGDMSPYHIMTKSLTSWKDLPQEATLNDLNGEIGNKDLFRQEIVFRIVAIELQVAILYRHCFKCPMAGLGCEVALNNCQSITRLDTIPTDGCCVRFYAEQKQLNLSRIFWSRED